MKLAITGSTKYADYDHFKQVVEAIPVPVHMLITGGQKGVEAMARQYAREKGLPVLVHHSRKEGDDWLYRRNILLLNDCDNALLFALGYSPTARRFERLGKKLGKRVNTVQIGEPTRPTFGLAAPIEQTHHHHLASRYGEEV